MIGYSSHRNAITAFVFVEFARVIKMRVPETHKATLTWRDNIRERPSAQL